MNFIDGLLHVAGFFAVVCIAAQLVFINGRLK